MATNSTHDCCKGRWRVCPQCQGRGVSSAYLGAFTADDLDELGDEFLDDYRAGRFDQECRHCGGRTTVRVHAVDCEVDALDREWAAETRMQYAMSGDWR